jgi:hypothetical protein
VTTAVVLSKSSKAADEDDKATIPVFPLIIPIA